MELINQNELNKVVKLVGTNNISCLVSPTGSGKSSVVPVEFVKNNAIVYCVQPTKNSVLSLYHYVKNKYRSVKVGYILSDEKKNLNNDCKLVYCSPSYIKNFLIKNFNNKDINFNILMLDEIHIGKIEYDIIVSLWVSMCKRFEVPRLFLSSAIINLNYIPVDLTNKILEIKKKSTTQIFYHDKFFSIKEQNNLFKDLKYKILEFHSTHEIKDYSTWIVFLNGKFEVDKFIRYFGENKDINIVSNNKLEEKDYLIKGVRSIIVTTNVYESSSTLKYVDGIFDSMLEKISIISPTGNTKLLTKNISKSSAVQRAGRTGRDRKGFVYRMCTEDFYKTLSNFNISELNRTNLSILFLELFSRNINPIDLFSFRLDDERISQFISELENFNLIKDNKLISIETTNFIFKHREFGINQIMIMKEWVDKEFPLFPLIVLFSFISTNTYIFKNSNESLVDTYLNLWDKFAQEIKSINPSKHELSEWCYENNLNLNGFEQLLKKIKEIYENLREYYKIDIGRFDTKNFVSNIKDIISIQNTIIFNKLKDSNLYTNSYDELFSLQEKPKGFSAIKSKKHDKVAVFRTFSPIDAENRHTGKNYIKLYLPL